MTAPPASSAKRAQQWPPVVLQGAQSGLKATLAMSSAMLIAQRLGLLGRAPPLHIVEHGLRRLRIRHLTTPSSRRLLAVIAHLGYGATQGVVFATLSHIKSGTKRGQPAPTTREGIGFALLLWGLSYAGWIPALRILPPPSKDRAGRPTAMVLAHVLYGVALARSLARADLSPSG